MIYFVATPIGNLKDISLRALEVLRSVDEIFCEDTRQTLKLLNFYEIKKPLVACHKYNERYSFGRIWSDHNLGKNIAIVSDAGMPAISDPGNIICKGLRDKGIPYTVVPGANAALSALILSAFPAERFAFIGFLPGVAGERRRLLGRYKDVDLTLCFHVAPQDIDRYVSDMYSVFGERRACAVREITKIHEEVQYFSLSAGLEGEKRGEYVIIVEGAEKSENPLNSLTEKEHILHYMQEGYDKKEAVKLAARDRGVSKSALYKFALEL